MKSERNYLDDFVTRAQCDEIPFDGHYYDSFMSRVRGNSSCRSVAKHNRYNDDCDYDPNDPWYLDSYPKFDW